MSKRLPACGNPQCSCSTGIHEGLTFGSGTLDHYGYWEKPCRICAEEWDKGHAERVQSILSDPKFKTLEDAQKYVREAEWLQLKGWPWGQLDSPRKRNQHLAFS